MNFDYKLPEGWVNSSIDDLRAKNKTSIAIGPFGSRMKSDCYVETGIPVIRGTNLTGGRAFEGEFVYITEEKANELGGANVYKNDLVFPHRGAIGEVGIISEDRRYVLSTSLMKLTCNRKKAYPLFLYYFFKSKLGRHELLKNASQVGTPGIGQPLTSLKNIRLNLPPLNQQEEIAKILGSLDDKIELNRQINQTLEHIAQAIFKSWFVDFEPVKAKIQAKQNAQDLERAAMCAISGKTDAELDVFLDASTPEQRQQLTATAALFPDELEESELGPIPKGWGVKPLDAIAVYQNGLALQKYRPEHEQDYLPVVKRVVT
jgi:type I restriction enzyme S subunit